SLSAPPEPTTVNGPMRCAHRSESRTSCTARPARPSAGGRDSTSSSASDRGASLPRRLLAIAIAVAPDAPPQIRVQKALDIAVEHRVEVAHRVARASVLHTLIRMQEV